MIARVLPGFFSLIFPVLLRQPCGIAIVASSYWHRWCERVGEPVTAASPVHAG